MNTPVLLLECLPLKRLGNISLLSGLVLLSLAFAIFGPMPGRGRSVREMQIGALSARDEAQRLDPDVAMALNVLREHGFSTEPPALSSAVEESLPEAAAEPVIQAGASSQAVAHIVKPGETLFSIWKQYGAPKTGGAKAAEAWKEAGVSLHSLRPGDKLRLTVENGDIAELRRTLRNGDEIILRGDSKNGYSASLRKVRVVESELTASGFISTSFSASARSASVPYALIDELVDLFSGRIEFRRDLQAGDSFTVSYLHRTIDGRSLEADPGEILAASIIRGGAMYAVVRHVGKDGHARYYNEQGEPVGNYFLRYPLQFSRISSVFSNARLHPVLQRLKPHHGVDFAAPVGTPVRAVADGVVTDAGYRGSAGNLVQIAHTSRYSTAYLHLSKIAPSVRRGARISRGQLIGAVGMTGLASGPHLHFSLYDRGVYVDPLKVALPTLASHEERMPPQALLIALNSLRTSQQALMLAYAPPGAKERKLG